MTCASVTARRSRTRLALKWVKKRSSTVRVCLWSCFEYHRTRSSSSSASSTVSKERRSIDPRLLPAARVRTPEHLREVRDLDVGVALGRLQRAVAEEFLDVTDVGAALEEVRRDRMPERVAGRVLLQARFLGRGLDDAVQEVGVHAPAAQRQEEPGRLDGAPDLGPAVQEICLDRL